MSAKPISVYPGPELKQRIEHICSSERRSMNQQLLMWIEEGVARHEAQEPPVPEPESGEREPGEAALASSAGDDLWPQPSRPPRKSTCMHGRKANEYCSRCDAT